MIWLKVLRVLASWQGVYTERFARVMVKTTYDQGTGQKSRLLTLAT